MTTVPSITKLAAEWHRLTDDFNSKEVDDDAIDAPMFKKIVAIEARLVKAVFKTAADMLAGLKILFGGDDPSHWCEFRVALYARMQQYA
jgi:hypothetical protein